MTEFRYRPDVDGLRAVAVGMVLLFHAGLGFPGGYVGVDVFFVISGFLITGLILKEQQAGQFSLANFWLRRIRRIIPAVATMVAAVLIAGYWLLLPSDYADLGRSTIAQQLMLSNVYFWQNTGYFDGAAELKPLLHTWSLAVEEQFYLGYPFLLLALSRRPRGISAGVLATVAVLSFGASWYGVIHHPSATFYLLPTRVWELLIGGLIWFLPAPVPQRTGLAAAAGWTALAGILLSGWLYRSNTPFPGLAALLPCGATAVFIYVNFHRLTGPARMLASRPVVFLGLISYSLYLWHWPILVFVRYRIGDNITTPLACAALALAGVLSWLSWKFVELPFRRKSCLPRPRSLVAAAAISALVLCAIGHYITTDGARWRYPDSFLAMVTVPYAGRNTGATGDRESGWVFPRLGDHSEAALPPAFLLCGDSFSKCASQLCHEIAARFRLSGYDAGRGGTPPLLGAWTATEGPQAAEFNEFVFAFAEREQIPCLILMAGWDIHADGMSKLADRQGGDPFEVLKRSFERTLERAERNGMRVVVVLQPPYQWENVPLRVARDTLGTDSAVNYGVDRARHEQFHKRTSDYFRSLGQRVTLIDISDHCFDDNRRSIVGRHGRPYYSDAGHPSEHGVRVLFETPFTELFAELARRHNDG